jgi:hypothetical protein
VGARVSASRTVLGHVVATEQYPSTPHHFRFASRAGAVLGIGSLVRVDEEGRAVFGVVTDAFAFTGPIAAAPDDAPMDARTPRETRLWTVAVLRQDPDEPMQPVPLAPVLTATQSDVRTALRMDGYGGEGASRAVPAGLYAAGGMAAPVLLDADFLLGPEAAHLNISGVSGLATKTSAALFFLASLFQRLGAEAGSVAAVCFNVKGPDLCFLDQPVSLDAGDRAMWRQLGLDPAPFADVALYAPFKPDGVNLNTLRTHPALTGQVTPLVWGLREVLDFAEVVLNRDDVDAKAGALLDFLADRVVGKRFEAPELRAEPFLVESFADLDELFRMIFAHLETSRGGEVWRTHHAATIRKIRNRLGNIATRARGLVTDDGPAHDLPWGAFRDRSMTVIDIAGIDPLAQDLVFARVVSKLREHLERRDLGVDRVVVFVDELNKYAPADRPETYVTQMLLDISERGRYLGLVLFSAQQFRSQVLRRVTGNAGTTVYGRMDSDELALPGYATLSPAVRAKLAALPKGELMVRHPHFTQPVFVRFPRPAVLSGREGVERFPPEPDLPFADAIVRRLKALDAAVPADAVRAAIDGRPEDEVRRAVSLVVQRRPDDVLAFFRGCLRRTIAAEPVEPRRGVAPLAGDDGDPFAPY